MGTGIIWALFDNRAGNNSQVHGVIRHLSDYQPIIVNLEYNKLSNIPNILKFKSAIGVTNNISDQQLPNVIISAGRKMADYAVYLKNLSQKQGKRCFLVHMMWPDKYYPEIDLNVISKHDLKYQKKNTYITAIQPSKIPMLPKGDENSWLILIGGDHKSGKMIVSDIKDLFSIIKTELNSKKLYISTSPRTPIDVLEYIKNNLPENTVEFFDFKSKVANPYLSFLEKCQNVIATADSIAMCSEIITCSRNLHIFPGKFLCGKKHKVFIQNVYDEVLADILTDSVKTAFRASKSLDTGKEIATIIEEFLSKKP